MTDCRRVCCQGFIASPDLGRSSLACFLQQPSQEREETPMRKFSAGLYKIKVQDNPDGMPVYGHMHSGGFLATHKGYHEKQPVWYVDHMPTGGGDFKGSMQHFT